MSLDTLMVHDVVVVHPGTIIGRTGDLEFDWLTATTTASKAWVSQRSATEDDVARTLGLTSEWICFLPPTTAVTAGDRIIWEGSLFDVVGKPNPAGTPRGLHHYEAGLRLVTG